jgi:hypothetical protein
VVAVAGNGPPANPNAIRRNTRVGLVRLPAAGRRGRTPKWPLPDNPRLTARVDIEADLIEELEQRELDDGKLSRTDATKLTRAKQRLAIAETELRITLETETALWRELWRTPQAGEWERLKWTREVAQYVRHKVAAECGNLDESKEARLRAEALGLTPKGLRSLMWVIAEDEVAQARSARQAEDTAQARRRQIRAVDTGS